MRQDPEGTEKRYVHRMSDLAGARVLEIGSGDGRMIWQYADSAAQVVGTDPSCEKIAGAARTRPASIGGKVRFVVAEGEALPFVDKAFDGAIFAWSL